MTLQTAIQKAIEGGWNAKQIIGLSFRTRENHAPDYISNPVMVLEPLFWQSLGKSLGWKVYCKGSFLQGFAHKAEGCEDCIKEGWLYHWHRFIDHLAEGKSIESFFETL